MRSLTISTPPESTPSDNARRTKSDPTADAQARPEYPDEPGLLDNVADKFRFRHRVESNTTLKTAYRVAVGVVGFAVLSAGLVMIPFPGPGWLVVIAGLAILSTEFAWAERLLDFTRKRVFAWVRWVNSQSIWIRLLIGLATAVFVYGVIVLALHLTGVPSWIPDWVPLWR